ncbi:type II toxin-antitoxin system VapC family toxin [Nitratiruptor sp. SB155-2]|uniref:type II toxin-antitoxin system VapC family toxin n=1 Tax=Nitratiruptor sp. (strain SB155-2) TaxID=387092 RepID=UPI0001586D39|nr:type II toxin-antitoxin system VapC family toxin [Nitratiruptor sp. SB155-2]BAF69334.1 conserved hypothetical protein [Nitratiruptor sp. SB155-2]
MKILIDTHIFLWLLYEPEKLSISILETLASEDNDLLLSSISIAEISIKKSLHKLNVEFDLDYVLEKLDIKTLDFDAESAMKLYEIPYFHKDPFDRMLISQALVHNLVVATVDEKFKFYEQLGLILLKSNS